MAIQIRPEISGVSPTSESTSHQLAGEDGVATPSVGNPSDKECMSSPRRGHTAVEGDITAMSMVGAENGLVTCTRPGRMVRRPVTLVDYV